MAGAVLFLAFIHKTQVNGDHVKKSVSNDIRTLLPELFGPADRGQKRPSGGMCTPESGCGPSGDESALAIVRIVTQTEASRPRSAEDQQGPEGGADRQKEENRS